MKRVLKWNVEVDDLPHPIGSGKVVHVACQHADSSVQVWTEQTIEDGADIGAIGMLPAQVYGTGQNVPQGRKHVGSALALNGRLVWHVYVDEPW